MCANKVTPESKAAFLKMRKKQLLEGRQKTLLKTIEAIKINDITKIELSSRAGQFYKQQIIDFYGQEAFDNELKRRRKIRKQKVKERNRAKCKTHRENNWSVPKLSLSQNTWNIRKKRIEEIGLNAYREERKQKCKQYMKEYCLENRDKRKVYDEKHPEAIKEQMRRYREKNKEKILFKKRKQYEMDEDFRKKVQAVNRRNFFLRKPKHKEKYNQQEKEKIMNGLYFNEEAKKNRIAKLNENNKNNKKNKKKKTIKNILKEKHYEETFELLSKAELIFENSFIIDFQENSIFLLDSKIFYGVYLNNCNIFDLLIKDENGYTFAIVGKNNTQKNSSKRAIVKKISFKNWVDVENFAAILKKGFC